MIAGTPARHTGPVTPQVRLARVQFTPPGGPGAPGPVTRAVGQLVLDDGAATHVVRLDDVLGLLTDLVSNVPHPGPAQVVSARRDGERVQVRLSSPAGQVLLGYPPDQWYQDVVSMIAQVAEEAERVGATDLLRPLLAAISRPDE